jgi:hypothetical protein
MTEKEHLEDLQDLGAELERVQRAYKIACQNIVLLNEQRCELADALSSAMNVIDQLLTDLRLSGGTPSHGLIMAKGKLDVTMRKLLKHLTV